VKAEAEELVRRFVSGKDSSILLRGRLARDQFCRESET
jgi:hypothetical protein